MLALRAFVTGQDQKANLSILSVDVTHSNLQQRHLESRFALDETLYDLRLRIYQTTGTPPRDQHLQVYDHADALEPAMEIPADYCVESDDQVPLLSFFHQGVRGKVHCVDTNPHSASVGGALENVKLVPKFRLSDEEYDRRTNTLRAWARKQKQSDPSFTLERHASQQRELLQARMQAKRGMPLPPGFEVDPSTGQVVRAKKANPAPAATTGSPSATDAEYDEASVQHALLSSRCQVSPGGRRGAVRWTGKLENKPGWWIGVELDEPVGQNDGSLDGVRYFSTDAKRGSFVRGPNLQVGDFPERDLLDDDSDDDGDEM
jgi:tubulin-folding cofactor B